MSSKLLMVLFFSMVVVISAQDVTPIVPTTTGLVQGFRKQVFWQPVDVYLGIPFAQPPVGQLRFRKPLPIQPWTGILNAVNFSPACMQYLTGNLTRAGWVVGLNSYSEDCLYLNIWTPSQPGTRGDSSRIQKPLKDVFFWLHSGAFTIGGTAVPTYDGSVLAAYGDIVVVTTNYRIGIFGFLNAGNDEVPGNMGLYDQTLALQWVRDNIANFGGNPERITIAGTSAGGISVGLHLLSPISQNLFQRAIMQSGTPYHPVTVESNEKSLNRGNTFAASVGCATPQSNLITDPIRTLACLRSINALDLAYMERQAISGRRGVYSFVPHHGEAFIPYPPIQALKQGNVKPAQLLVGGSRDEGSILLPLKFSDTFTTETAQNITLSQAVNFEKQLFSFLPPPLPDLATELYINSVRYGGSPALRKALYDSIGDYLLFCPTVHYGEEYGANGFDTYYYFFTHRRQNSDWGEWLGVVHFDDVFFVFGVPFSQPQRFTDQEREMSQRMMDIWVTFSKTGKPPNQLGLEWPKFSTSHPFYMELQPVKAYIGVGPHLAGCRFWKNITEQPNLADILSDS